MYNKKNLKLNLNQRRLVYAKNPETPNFIIEPQKKKENKPNPDTSLGTEERQELKKAAVSEGKRDAQESFQIKPKITGIRLNSEKLKKVNNEMIEQPFEFGDTKIPGKILIPSDMDPNKKVTYVFNYVSNPDKYDHSKLGEVIQKNKDKVGNTIVITLKTPDDEIQINGQKFETIQKLSSEIESLQERFKSNPQLSHLVLPDTNQFLFMSDPSEAQKLSSQLTNFYQANQNRNLKFPKEPQIWSNQPETFVQQLSEYLDQSTEDNQENEQATVGGGGGGFGGGGSSKGSEQISTESESSSTENIPENTGNTPESTEQIETSSVQIDKLLIIGDSLMTGVENKLKANDKLRKAKVGKFTSEMLNDMKSLDQSKQLETYRNQTMIINGGINDIAAGKSAEEIYGNFQQIWEIAKKYSITVYTCTVTPFKGYPTFNNNFGEKEKVRNKLNDLLISNEGGPNGPQKLIMLHKRKSEGGLANDNDLSELDTSFEGPDHLHLNPSGYDKMSEIIQGQIGVPQEKTTTSKAQSNANIDISAMKPELSSKPISTENFKVTATDRLAAEQFLKEVNSSQNPSSRIGEIRQLPGGKILKVAWHQNHDGYYGTSSYKEKPGKHIGVQVERDPNQKTT